MKKIFRLTARFAAFITALALTATTVTACWYIKKPEPRVKEVTVTDYEVPQELLNELEKIYRKYNFTIGWGLYNISDNQLREVASYHTERKFQSNCTIKAAMLLFICQKLDSGELSLDTKIDVKKSKLHYGDFGEKDGKYMVRDILTRMINVSNNACYEVFLQYVTKESFNEFLSEMGSKTKVDSYKNMGYCFVRDRAVEWYNLYSYCHSQAKHASFAWELLKNARYSPIRDGIGREAAHKSGWNYEKGAYGTAGDCAVVQTPNGGCYLMVMFTRNNEKKTYSQKLMREIAVVLDKTWDGYYSSLSAKDKKTAKF